MSAITIENDLVHYEVLGRGRPVIFVHGWLGSWRYWVPTMQQISTKYRTYALDLWGFGDSGKDGTRYDFKSQVTLLHNFMEKLGIEKAALVGHSLGAAICLRFASQYPTRAPRLALISSPLFDLGGLDDTHAPTAATTATTGGTANTGSSTTGTTAAAIFGQGGSADLASSASETIPRNPFRGLNDSSEDILAKLQAKNTVTAAGAVPQAAPAKPLPPGAPALPISIATPILAKPATAPADPATPAPGSPASTGTVPPASASSTPGNPADTGSTPPATATPPAANTSPASPVAPAVPPAGAKPADSNSSNPLISILTGVKPPALLTKHVDPHAPDLDKLRAEVEKTDEAAIVKSAQSFTGINLALELNKLSSPTLLLHGKDDPLLPAPSDELIGRIARGKQAGHLLAFVEPDLRHFPMLEISAKFNRLLMDFLDAQDLSNVQFKDQWRRTMR